MGLDLTGFGAAFTFLNGVLDRVIPDKGQAAAAKLQLLEVTQSGDLAKLSAETQVELAAAGTIKAEAQSGNWLTSAWRPITMLTFVALIVARVLGFTSSTVSGAEYLELWGLVKLGLGGYVIGRSAEKTAPAIVSAITSALGGKTT